MHIPKLLVAVCFVCFACFFSGEAFGQTSSSSSSLNRLNRHDQGLNIDANPDSPESIENDDGYDQNFLDQEAKLIASITEDDDGKGKVRQNVILRQNAILFIILRW